MKFPEYTITDDNLHIVDSWKVRQWRMRRVLRTIKEDAAPGATLVFNRSLFSLKCEWICHNVGFFAGIRPDETKDVDLNYPCKIEWLYIAGGVFFTILTIAILLLLIWSVFSLW